MANPERDLHRALVKQLQVRCKPDVLWWHTPNGGSRNVIEAHQLKLMGTLAGVPDLLFFHDGTLHGMELKAPGKKIKLTDEQAAFRDKLMKNRGRWWEANDPDTPLFYLKHAGLLR